MKVNKYIGFMMLSAGFVLAAASCTDYSDYNTEPDLDHSVGASKTLWENISSDQQLTKFTALAQKCKFSEALNSSRFYTLWAPVDEAFDDALYNKLMSSDSATVVKQFLQQHITEYNYPISAALDSTIIVSLNNKHHPFTQTSFDGYPYIGGGINLPSTNGVMHKINGLSVYHINLYENIDSLVDCDSIKNYIQKYDEYYLDVNASVLGPIREGKQTYLDSVMKKRNNVISRIMNADLENEDSSYCMFIPNNEAWAKAYASIKGCYNYIPKMDYMDLSKKTVVASSLKAATAKADEAAEAETIMQDSLTCRNLVKNLVFSKNNGYNQSLFNGGIFADEDSVFTTTRNYLTGMQEIMNNTVSVSTMSNGLVRVVDTLALKAEETYNPMVGTVIPAATMKVKKLTAHNIPLDSLAGRDSLFSKVPEMLREWLFPAESRFFSYVAVDSADIDGKSGVPEFDFALYDLRSTTYHVYVVTVPRQVEDATAPVKPYYLRFYLSWTDADNKQQYDVLPMGSKSSLEITTDNGESAEKLICVGDPGRVNVLDLGEVTFPACYYGLDSYASLMMMHTKKYTTDKNRNMYDQQMRVAGVFFVPKDYNDKWANTENE